MSKHYAVIAEVRGGKLRQVTLEALHAVSLIQDEADHTSAILIGSDLTSISTELAAYVNGKVYVIDHPSLEAYNSESYFSAITPILDELQASHVVFGHTAIGRDLAPMTAAYLDAGQLSDVTSIEHIGSDIVFTRPLYAGKVFEKRKFINEPQVITIRPNNISVAAPVHQSAEIVPVSYVPSPSLRTIVRDVVRKTSGKVDLTEAKIVISGGRGVKSAEGFKPLEELAAVLNGAVGASRGACDAGYCDYALQIGQTGKVVTPEVYIACGISGAIQHLAGMSQSRIIIAINKDPEAPIFKIADYGIVGDLFEVVPLLTEEFKQITVS